MDRNEILLSVFEIITTMFSGEIKAKIKKWFFTKFPFDSE